MLCDNLEGWEGVGGGGMFKGEGTHLYLLLIHVDVWQKPTQYCKANIFRLKIYLKKGREGNCEGNGYAYSINYGGHFTTHNK